jgi:hypothetical protein
MLTLCAHERQLLVTICDLDTIDGMLPQIRFHLQICSRLPERLDEDIKKMWRVPQRDIVQIGYTA